jgi:hypothetical protein
MLNILCYSDIVLTLTDEYSEGQETDGYYWNLCWLSQMQWVQKGIQETATKLGCWWENCKMVQGIKLDN